MKWLETVVFVDLRYSLFAVLVVIYVIDVMHMVDGRCVLA
jgi:hypothetical protein